MATRYKIEEYEEWVRPYVIKTHNIRNEYCIVRKLPLQLAIEHKLQKYRKWTVYGNCEKCGVYFEFTWSNYCNRKRTTNQILCGKCALKNAINQKGWREANSKAQLKVQGTPEARQRMSDKLKQVHKDDPNIRNKISQGLKATYKNDPDFRAKVSAASLRNWKRLDYQEKVVGKGYHHGYLLHNQQKIYFGSSWELMFLMWCQKHNNIAAFGRCKERIPYKKPDGGKAYYHPDFEVIWKNRNKTIIEIKGGRSDFDIVQRKAAAAQKHFNSRKTNYIMMYKEDLQRLGILRNNKHVLDWILTLEKEGKVEYHGCGKNGKEVSLQRQSA